jgi:hypothetical protein
VQRIPTAINLGANTYFIFLIVLIFEGSSHTWQILRHTDWEVLTPSEIIQVLYRRPAHSSPHKLRHCTNRYIFWGHIITEEQVSCTNGRRCNYQDSIICIPQAENISFIFGQQLPLSLVHTTSINSRIITFSRFYLSLASLYLHWRIVVHSMEHRPSWEAKRCWKSKIFLSLLQNPRDRHEALSRVR